MDPALIDRTSQPVIGITHASQPDRAMTISGIEHSVPARILSTNLRGTATRLVRLNPGWGSRLAGCFTANVEIFVLKGDIRVGSVELADYEYVGIPSGGVVGGFRTEMGAIALLMTSGPVRYDTSSGGASAKLVVGRPANTGWEREFEEADIYVRPLATSEISEVWLGSTRQHPENPLWHEHTHDEETFVLDGSVDYIDERNDETVSTHASPGSYYYRPAGRRHTVPVLASEEAVLMFHRSLGGHETLFTPGDVVSGD